VSNQPTEERKVSFDSIVGVSDEEHPVMEDDTSKNPFMVDAPTFNLCMPCCSMLRTLSVCTCGESVSDEEVAADQDIMRCL